MNLKKIKDSFGSGLEYCINFDGVKYNIKVFNKLKDGDMEISNGNFDTELEALQFYLLKEAEFNKVGNIN